MAPYNPRYDLVEKFRLRHAVIYVVSGFPNIAVVEAIAPYIPIEQFKEVFVLTGELIISDKITKLIFDKRNLTVFHQPSMEWYFVEWKEKMFDYGLSVHRKILPPDEVFRQSVKIGRDKIKQDYPNGKFTVMDIAYSESLDEAITL